MVPGTSFETILRASVDKGLHPQLKGDEDKWIAMRIARHRTLDTFERQSEGGRWEQVDRYRTHDGGTLIIGTDVTERKMVEDKLRRTQQRLIEAISRVAIGVDIYDAQDRLSLTSGGQGRIGSQTPDLFVIGENFEVILRRTVESGRIPEANEDPEKWIQWRLARHRQKKHPTEFMHNDGTWVQLLEYATDDGGTLVIRSDITERKNAEVEI
jgi:PAS domain-containing protein